MNETHATENDYTSLNDGSDDELMSREYRRFNKRIAELWLAGEETNGQSGILPMKPYPELLPHLALEFVWIRQTSRIRFRCGEMTPAAAEAHLRIFESLYAGENATDTADQEGRWMEMKVRVEEEVVVPTPIAPPSVLPPKKVREWRPKKNVKADPFDPFSGLLY